jgi:hypothetical protein
MPDAQVALERHYAQVVAPTGYRALMTVVDHPAIWFQEDTHG